MKEFKCQTSTSERSGGETSQPVAAVIERVWGSCFLTLDFLYINKE